MGAAKIRPLAERYREKVAIGLPDACWPWTGARDSNGYGRFSVGHAKSALATRVGYKLAFGVEPGELFVCHSCDWPPCCNPAHWFLGDQVDNMRDCASKGRTARWSALHPEEMVRGEDAPWSKLTTVQVEAIKRRIMSGDRNEALRRDFHVGLSTIQDIRKGRNWKHVPWPTRMPELPEPSTQTNS